jgi:hypothetical protein
MKCFGDFKGDRICDLCGETTPYRSQCIALTKKKEKAMLELKSIAENCPHAKPAYHDGEHFIACCKDGKNPRRSSEVCKVTFTCRDIE